MAVPFSNTKLRVPRGFQNLLEGLAKAVLKNQPDNILSFAAKYFGSLVEIREEQGIDPAEIGAKHEDRFYNNKAFSKAGNMGDVSDPQQQEAATTIQAAVRGHQSREEVKPKTSEEDTIREEDEAASRIQAAYRGYEARKRVNLLKDDEEEDRTKAEAEGEEEGVDIDLDDPEVEKAATKIQASFRGFQTRKSMKDKEKLSEDTEPPGEGVHEGDVQKQPEPTDETQHTEAAKGEEIDIDLTDPEVEKAAVKIQGGFKMLKARKEVEEMRKSKDESSKEVGGEEDGADATPEKMEEDAALAEEKEEVDIDLSDPEVVKAAETIQSTFRGFQTRKKLKEEAAKEETAEAPGDVKAAEDQRVGLEGAKGEDQQKEPIAEEEEEVDIDLTDPEVEQAALKIQAGFKGLKVRKELKAKSEEKTEEKETAGGAFATDAEPQSTQEEIAPSNEEAPPTEGDAPPTEGNAPPPTEEKEPAVDEAPSTERDAPPPNTESETKIQEDTQGDEEKPADS